MDHQKIINLLDRTSDNVPRFITKKWAKVHDQSDGYSINKQITFKTPMLQSDLCDYSDAYIVAKGTITVTNADNNAYDKKLTSKNNAPFTFFISNINNNSLTMQKI